VSTALSLKYERSVTEQIPEDVTRARSAAWLDLLSPLTEWAGLRGDELRHRRQLLRVQQEERLAEIVEQAHKKIAAVGPRQIPLKFLVPFLEQASIEEDSPELKNMWSSLLASAAEDYSSQHIHFVSIISRLSARQAEIFRKILNTSDSNELG